ncbi:hypothetical protein [Aeromicrobium sp. UC242_57]|uniref:hypothetical protein n=1 Tax=Aeromicrobium sp. UC242_57 TaxID=3374624 RepID=UPI003797CDDC
MSRCRRDGSTARCAAGLRTAAGAALRGSLPMLFPLYVLFGLGAGRGRRSPWPDDVLGTGWGIAWVLMPLAAVGLALRSVSRVRLRFGSMLMATIYLAGAALAAILFVAYPYAL